MSAPAVTPPTAPDIDPLTAGLTQVLWISAMFICITVIGIALQLYQNHMNGYPTTGGPWKRPTARRPAPKPAPPRQKTPAEIEQEVYEQMATPEDRDWAARFVKVTEDPS